MSFYNVTSFCSKSQSLLVTLYTRGRRLRLQYVTNLIMTLFTAVLSGRRHLLSLVITMTSVYALWFTSAWSFWAFVRLDWKQGGRTDSRCNMRPSWKCCTASVRLSLSLSLPCLRFTQNRNAVETSILLDTLVLEQVSRVNDYQVQIRKEPDINVNINEELREYNL